MSRLLNKIIEKILDPSSAIHMMLNYIIAFGILLAVLYTIYGIGRLLGYK